uniref:Serpentine receptor class gamma n=1 Tax=Globodera rostochiensis TaxID=31243 RepID=A0A914HQ71_GLORO
MFQDLLYVLDSFYGNRLPLIIGAVLYPIYSKFPNWMFVMFFFIAGHTFLANYLVTAFILLNRLTAIIMPIKHEKIWQKFLPFITIFVYFVPTLVYWPTFKMDAILIMNDPNSTTDRSFFVYAAGNLNSFTDSGNTKTVKILYIYYPLLMDTGTVVLSSWLLLWASSIFRQQLIKDFTIIRIRNIRVGPMEGPQNNDHRAVEGAVGHQLQNRICSSVQQLPTIS